MSVETIELVAMLSDDKNNKSHPWNKSPINNVTAKQPEFTLAKREDNLKKKGGIVKLVTHSTSLNVIHIFS